MPVRADSDDVDNLLVCPKKVSTQRPNSATHERRRGQVTLNLRMACARAFRSMRWLGEQPTTKDHEWMHEVNPDFDFSAWRKTPEARHCV